MIRTRDHHAVRAERAFPRPPGPSPAVLRPGLQGAPLTPRASDRLLLPMEPRAVSSLPPASFSRPHGCKLHIMWWHVAILHKHGSIFKKFLMTVDAHAAARSGPERSRARLARQRPVATDILQNGLRRWPPGCRHGRWQRGACLPPRGPSGPFSVTLASPPPPPHPQPPEATDPFSISLILSFQECRINRIRQYVTFLLFTHHNSQAIRPGCFMHPWFMPFDCGLQLLAITN